MASRRQPPFLTSLLLGLALCHGALAQSQSAPAPAADDAARSGPAAGVGRWFELQTAFFKARYHYRETSAGVVATDAIQHRETFQGRFKFDGAGNYSVTAQVSTGKTFTAGWDNFEYGTGRATTNVYLRHLFFTARPARGVELHVGGFDMLRGAATEITTYNNDAYMVGERLSVRRPNELFFDEISVTYGYLGDFNQPNLNKRYHRLKQSNYHQFLVGKKIGRRATVSADYSFYEGVETLRQAVKVSTKELRVLDAVTFENYQRVDVKPDYGFALHGEKTLRRRLTVTGGFTQIDPHYPSINADRFFQGRHLFFTTNFAINSELSVGTFYTHRVATDFAIPVKTRFELVMTCNLLKAMQKAGWFK
jgi:hypothetical protein